MEISSLETPKKPRGKVPRRSKIWEVFEIVEDDPCKAVCLQCQYVVSRGGGTAKSQCTTNLWNHLKNKHTVVFAEMSKYKEEVHRKTADKSSWPKSILEYDCLDKSKVWELFTIDSKDYSTAKCLECHMEINGEGESGTDPLWYHVMTNHPSTYSKCVSEALENVALCTKGKRSTVWTEFTQHPLNICKVICNTCDTIVSRGTSRDRLNTTNMRRHLSGSHHRSKANQATQKAEVTNSDQTQNGILSMNDCLAAYAKKFVEQSPESRNSNDGNDESLNITKQENENPDTNMSFTGSTFPQISDADTIMKKRKVDMVHTALVMDTLYEQQKIGVCCDFSLFVRHDIPNSIYNRQGKDNTNNGMDQNCFQESAYETEFKLHSCVAATVSNKLRTVIESGCDRLTIKDVSKNAVQAFMQIAYTGKLTEISELNKQDLMQIHGLASLLSTTSAVEYLERSYPKQNFFSHSNTVTHKKKLQSPLYNLNTIKTRSPMSRLTTDNHSPVSPEGIKVHETDGLIGYTAIPKINKRKNYMPMANESSRKKSRNDSKLNDASTEVSTDSEQLSPNTPKSEELNNVDVCDSQIDDSICDKFNEQSQLPPSLTINNDNTYEKPKVLESPTNCSKSSPSNSYLGDTPRNFSQTAEATPDSYS